MQHNITHHIFGYGSLMNPWSIVKTLPRVPEMHPVTVQGFQRKVNALHDGHLYMNLVRNTEKSVHGFILHITTPEFELLRVREASYDLIDITEHCSTDDYTVHVFVTEDRSHPNKTIRQSYLDICFGHLPAPIREEWLEETIIENPIV